MYDIDKEDRVIELKTAPQSSVGAPIPLVLSDEYSTVLAYYLEERSEGWDGTTVRIVGPDTEGEPIALVKFRPCYAHIFGPPNDEAFSGHPLAQRGLHPYGVFQIEHSSWLRKLERMNSVHPQHNPKRFLSRKHFVFTFHDSVFECIAEGFRVETSRGSAIGMIPRMTELLNRDAG